MKKFFSIAMVFIFVLLAVSCDGGSSEKYDDKDLINQDDDASLNDDSISDDDSEKADGDAKEEVGDGDLGKTDEGGTTGDGDEVEVSDDDGFSSGGKPADNPPEEEIVETLPDLETGVCQVKTGNAFKLIKGNILASDKTYIGGQLLISDKGMILCVGSDCDSKPEAKKATVITCPKGVVTPAFINAHDHLGYVNNKPGNWKDERYEHRHEWRTGSNGHAKISTEKGATEEQKQWAELRQIMSGTVSIAGSGGATGLMRNLDQNCVKREGLGGIDVNYSTFPLGDSKGTMLESGCEYGDNKDKINKLECDCYLPHVAEGINQAARNEFLCLSGQEGGVDLTESNSAFIHLVGLVASDGEELAANQTALIWSPRTNVSLYGNTAPVTMFDNQGVLIGLGTDWLPSGSMNMLRELACVDYLNDVHFAKHFSDYQIWKMATLNNAFALRILDVVGAIRVGLAADIAIFDGTDAANFYRAVIAGHEKRVSLVLRGGEPLYGDENIISALDTANVCDSLKVCGVDKKVCVSDTGKNFEELKNKNVGMYPLFFCDVPEGEPTCVPQRTRPQDESRPYSGPTETDSDGDGIDDEEDNCPDIFNPIRPIDNLVQADADGDGVGDACDPCPLLKDSENCVVADINDRDGDGVLNAEDNCPFDANADQADGDGDGVGDACDACPNIANFLGAPCPTTIYEIKQKKIAPGTLVRVEGIATAVKGKNFFMQVDPKDHDPTLKEKFSGIYLFKSPVAVNIGDKIAATGTVALYHGQLQIAKVSAVEITSAAKGVPDFVTVAPEKIKNGGELKDAYNGVLVKVENVTVTEGADDYNVFGVADGLKVDDDFYSYENPEIGVNFRSLSGVLAYTFNYSKILPRNAEDFGIDKCANTTCDEKWSKCNPQSGECEAKEGFCAGKLDCPDEDEICDYSTHKCAPGDPCEGVICDDWAECSKITGSCVAKEGKCLNDSDCDGETSQCSPTTHECIASILKNGGFENWTDSLPDFWKGVKTNVSKSNILQETGTVRGGDAALKLQVDNKDHKRFTSKAVSLDAGSYSCEYYISGKAAEIRNSFFAATKFGSYSAYVPASAEWQKILFNFTLADAADDFEFVFSVRKTGDEKGFVIIDDLLCVKD